MATIEQILKSLDRLPAIPVSVTQLISKLCAPEDEVGGDTTTDIVMRDSALTADVLRAANSAALGFHVEATSINEALSRVGENQLLKIALAHASHSALGVPIEEYGLEAGDAWLGALAGAFAAEEISKATGQADPNVAFTAGLLRDIGKLAMGLVVPPYELISVLSVDSDQDVITREQAAFGFYHTQVGAALGRSWGLPETLMHSIRFHHDPPSDDYADALYDVVHCGDHLSMLLGYGVGFDGLNYKLHVRASEKLGLDRPMLEDLLANVRIRMEEFIDQKNDTRHSA